jgi:hypothetical protein
MTQKRSMSSLVLIALFVVAAIVTACAPASTGGSSASWESTARTVAEVASESDLIIYGRVAEAPVTRIVTHDLPVYEGLTQVATESSSTAFADTLFEVVKVYRGNAPDQLLVMQTGGILNSGDVKQFSDDPLYKVGEEYILFLVDISGDEIHAPDRELYRIVSPAGRFLISGNTATTFAEEYMNQQLPKNTDELERQITEAAAN